MPTNVSLQSLIAKIRKIIARPSSTQISDNNIIDYIDKYYELDFPMEFKSADMKTEYKFYTNPGVDRYQLSSYTSPSTGAEITGQVNMYKSFEPPVYVSGYEAKWYQDRESFYKYFPDITTSATFGVATGAAGPYSGTLPSVPILRNSVVISTVVSPNVSRIVIDTGTGGFMETTGIAIVGPTIDYDTGAINGLLFNGGTTPGEEIIARWTTYSAGKPYACLFFDNTFILRPVPDAVYELSVQAYLKPTALYQNTQEPALAEWFDLLAYGTSLKIFIDSMEMESYQMLYPIYKQQLDKAERKTIMQIKTQRTRTIFSESGDNFSHRYPIY